MHSPFTEVLWHLFPAATLGPSVSGPLQGFKGGWTMGLRKGHRMDVVILSCERVFDPEIQTYLPPEWCSSSLSSK
jgi:hypothetical protein